MKNIVCKHFGYTREVVGLVPVCKQGRFIGISCYSTLEPKLDCFEKGGIMKGWRPEKGWKNPFNPAAITVRDRNGKPISHHEACEVGADVMHKADVEWLEAHDHKEGLKTMFYLCIPREDWQAFRGNTPP